MAGVQLPEIGSTVMNTSWALVLGYSSIPVALMLIGRDFKLLKKPTPAFTSVVQHFAAEVVFAEVAVELIPVSFITKSPWIIFLGFAAGVAVMLFTEWLSDKLSVCLLHPSVKKTTVIAHHCCSIIDVFIDGILVGVSF